MHILSKSNKTIKMPKVLKTQSSYTCTITDKLWTNRLNKSFKAESTSKNNHVMFILFGWLYKFSIVFDCMNLVLYSIVWI